MEISQAAIDFWEVVETRGKVPAHIKNVLR